MPIYAAYAEQIKTRPKRRSRQSTQTRCANPSIGYTYAMNILQTIEHHAQRLEAAGVSFGHGTTNAFDEAAWLVLWQLQLPLDDLERHAEQSVSEAQAKDIAELVQKRIATRKPTAYLTQEAWLQGVAFYIDERSIVPRSLIAELLADGSIDPWLSDQTTHVLDLCTGNGSLAVLAAMAYPTITVTAADISQDALDIAAININKHQLQTRIACVLSDGLQACTGTYDLILCNPPYVNSASMAGLSAEYQQEPNLALAGGNDGMDFVRQMLKDVPEKLSDNGVLVLEIGHEKPYFEAAFPQLNPVWMATSSGDDMVLLLTKRDAAVREFI